MDCLSTTFMHVHKQHVHAHILAWAAAVPSCSAQWYFWGRVSIKWLSPPNLADLQDRVQLKVDRFEAQPDCLVAPPFAAALLVALGWPLEDGN